MSTDAQQKNARAKVLVALEFRTHVFDTCVVEDGRLKLVVDGAALAALSLTVAEAKRSFEHISAELKR